MDLLFTLHVPLKFVLDRLRNRDAEEKLMKDVDGWEVGTWYGHPIYKVSSSTYFSVLLKRVNTPWSLSKPVFRIRIDLHKDSDSEFLGNSDPEYDPGFFDKNLRNFFFYCSF